MSLEHRKQTLALIEDAVASGARLSSACDEAGVSANTVRRWRGAEGEVKSDARPDAQRPIPSHALTLEERQQILDICHSEPFKSLPPSQIVPALADQGIYIASESSYYRVLRDADEQQYRGRAQPPKNRAKPAAFEAIMPNQCWSWDVSYMKGPIKGDFFYLYMVMDVYSRKIVGWEVHEQECAIRAAELIDLCVRREGHCSPQILHADNGSIQKASTLRIKLIDLGIEPSYSRPRVSNDNAFSESLFRTTKYRPDYPFKGFESLEQAREWVASFVFWYNEKHRHSAIRFVTPAQRHSGEERLILSNRDELYAKAKQRNPGRWTGSTRNWQPVGKVVLNPDKETKENEKIAA